MFIYTITNVINGSIYVGKTINAPRKRFNQHRTSLDRGVHDNKELQADWNEYGLSAFKFDTIRECLGHEALAICEIAVIQQFLDSGTVLYNSRLDSFQAKYAPVTVERMRQSAQKRVQEKPNKGHLFSEESKAKIAEAVKQSWENPERGATFQTEAFKTKVSVASTEMWAKREDRHIHDEATRQRIGDATRGRVRPEAERQRISQAMTGRKLSPETKAKLSAARQAYEAKKRDNGK